MRKSKRIPVIVILVCFITCFCIAMLRKRMSGAETIPKGQLKTECPESFRQIIYPTGEMRAIWVPFMSLDMKNEDASETSFRGKFRDIVQNAKNAGINTLIVHVRPFSDAMYKSEIFPWSHILGSDQGASPGFDPLNMMIEETHKENMSFHAWVNPLRISFNNMPPILYADNPAIKLHRDASAPFDLTIEWENGKYYNPAYAKVRKLIIDGVKEIVRNYDVDAIHFDDYFYPTDDEAFDKSSYDAYVTSCDKNSCSLTQMQWRKSNINLLVSGVYSAIKSINPNVQFGISPQGNMENDEKISADIATWCKTPGYLDYICPQIYTNFENPVLPFDSAALKWKQITDKSGVKLYLGIGLYKAGSNLDGGTWLNSQNIISRQIECSRALKSGGFMLYSYDYLHHDESREEVQNAMKLLN